MAEMEFEVTNIDLLLSTPPRAWRRRYGIGLNRLNSYKATNYKEYLESSRSGFLKLTWLKKIIKSILLDNLGFTRYLNAFDDWRSLWGLETIPVGRIEWVKGNLCYLPEIPDGQFDALISLSVVEHIPAESLEGALGELLRIMKPDAHWAVTTSATHKDETRFHENSKGLCFSIDDLANFFQASPYDTASPEVVLEKYLRSDCLKNNLAYFYRKSGNNGMPWGVWDPQYIPVGMY